ISTVGAERSSVNCYDVVNLEQTRRAWSGREFLEGLANPLVGDGRGRTQDLREVTDPQLLDHPANTPQLRAGPPFRWQATPDLLIELPHLLNLQHALPVSVRVLRELVEPTLN